MKFKCFILVVVFCGLSNNSILSQNKQIDSVKLVLTNSKEDTNKVNTLIKLCSLTWTSADYINEMIYAEAALSLSKRLNFKKGEGSAYLNIGSAHDYLENYSEGVKNFLMALKIFEKSGDKNGEARALQFLGGTYSFLGNDSLALESILRASKINESIGNTNAQNYNSIAEIYIKWGRYDDALKEINTALRIFEGLAEKAPDWGTPWCYNLIGDIYFEQGKAENTNENSSNSVYNFNEALKNYLIALKLNEKAGNKEMIAESCFIIGNIQIILNNRSMAREYLDRGLYISKLLGKKSNIATGYLYFSKLDSNQGNYKQAYEHYKLYILYRDSLNNEGNVRKAEGHRLRYEFDKKENSLKQKQFLTDTKLQKQKTQKYFYWIGLTMLSLLSFFVFSNFRNQKKINRLAHEAHARQKAEQELQNLQAILNERLRISGELHDEVGATLSGIAMYSHLTKEQMKTGQTTEIEKSLNIMQQSSTQMVDKLSDIVWLINPEQDSLQKLVTRLEEYAIDMAAIKNIQVKISVPEKIADINLPVKSRRNIYLFCKEAINNAVKYSNATLLELTVKERDGKLEFSVSDNGKGFDAVMVRRGNGLENMQKRADEIGAKLILHSKENEGASVSLQCKIT